MYYLTNKEREIVQLLLEGKTVKLVEEHFNMNAKVFETYRRKIMEKLNIHKFN